MKVAIYSRVSTNEQNSKLQEDTLKEFCNSRNLTIYDCYTDSISGTKDSRPALNKMLLDAYNRRFDAVVIWKLDRLGRSLQHLVKVVSNLQKWKIDLICQTQPIDTTSPSGKLIFHIFGAIAEFERELISERTKLGLRKAVGTGKRGKDKTPRKKGGYYLRYQKKDTHSFNEF